MEADDIPDLVIFDFDGVIADSEGIAIEELAAEMTRRGATITVAEAQARFLGASTRDHIAFIQARTGDPAADFPAVWHERLFMRYATELQPVPGALETLDYLDARGIAYCIGSGGAVDRLSHALRHLGLAERFQGRAFSAEEVARGKPAPDLFLHAAARMGAEPAKCIVIEDAPAGIEAATAAGMHSIAFVGGSHLRGREAAQAKLLTERGAVGICPSHEALRALL